MFLNKVMNENRALLETVFSLHQKGIIAPDSYVVDVDQFINNAKAILTVAQRDNIKLFFMLKQLGRNPILAKELVKLGYESAVVVDYKEADIMMKNHIPLGNVGHLVQIPQAQIEKIVEYGTEVITVYSLDKIKKIHEAAKKLNKIQGIMIRVYDDNDLIYSGQTAGFPLKDLQCVLEEVKHLNHVKIKGVTSFPCYLFSDASNEFEPTNNLYTVQKAVKYFEKNGIGIELVDTPSATCTKTLERMKADGSNCAEPGHGLTGTTPSGAVNSMPEKISVIYVSEVSHNFSDKAYCFGGGYYRRSHVENALCGKNLAEAKKLTVDTPDLDSIDYHFGLSEEAAVGDTVVMAFRFQIFVTRSDVVLVKGISEGKPEIIGVFDSLGNEK